jgi:cyclase
MMMLAVLGLAIPIAVSAADVQNKPSPASPGAEQLSAHLVKTGLYLIAGGGANSLLRFSAIGSILIDGKLAGNYRPLMSQVRRISRISDLPVRVLIVTGHHEAHTGTNAQFLAAGVAIIAQENASRHFPAQESDGAKAAGGKPAGRIITYDRDFTLQMGGVEAHLKHFGRAHTNGDTVVYFPGLKVVAVGDLFTSGTPEPDFLAGGSLVDWGPVLSRIFELDFDVVVPSQGPTVTRADLEAFKKRIDAQASRAIALVKKGVPKDQLMAELKAGDPGWEMNLTGEALDRFYAELSEAK